MQWKKMISKIYPEDAENSLRYFRDKVLTLSFLKWRSIIFGVLD